MRIAYISAILAFLTLLSTCGQPNSTPQKCSLDLSHAPTLRGLRLGMHADQLKAQYLHLQVKSETDGESFAEVKNASEASKEFDFEGLDAIHLSFVDGQLSYIEFKYSNQSTTALKATEFVDRVAEQLGLNTKWCQNSFARLYECRISCEGFEVQIDPPETYISGSGLDTLPATVEFRDLVAAQKVAVRRQAKEEEEKRKFKP